MGDRREEKDDEGGVVQEKEPMSPTGWLFREPNFARRSRTSGARKRTGGIGLGLDPAPLPPAVAGLAGGGGTGRSGGRRGRAIHRSPPYSLGAVVKLREEQGTGGDKGWGDGVGDMGKNHPYETREGTCTPDNGPKRLRGVENGMDQ